MRKITKKQLTYLVEREVRKQLNIPHTKKEKKVNVWGIDTTFAEGFMDILEPYKEKYIKDHTWSFDTDNTDYRVFMDAILKCKHGKLVKYETYDLVKLQKLLELADEDISFTVSFKYGDVNLFDKISTKYHVYLEVETKNIWWDNNTNIVKVKYYIKLNRVLDVLPKLLRDIDAHYDEFEYYKYEN